MNLLQMNYNFFYSNVAGASRRGATNNEAEIQSATIAIQNAARMRIHKLCVNTDSKNLYDALTENIPKWRVNGWRSLYDFEPIENREEYEKLDHVIRSNSHMKIKFKHLPGHSGNQDHNEADHLASAGARLHYNH